MKQITKETGRGYEWKQDTDFEDAETLVHYLTRIGAKFTQRGWNIFANSDDVATANDEYIKDCNEHKFD